MFVRVGLSILLVSCLTNAQVQVKGRFQDTMLALQKAAHSPVYHAPIKPDNRALQAEETFTSPHLTKPYKFAESIPMTLDIGKDGVWEHTNALDGSAIKIWRAVVASDEAVSIGLQFEQFYLPEGVEMYLVGRDSMMGAFVGSVNNKEDGSFATVPIVGDFVGVEVVALDGDLVEPIKLRLGKIAHGFRSFPKNFQDSGSCNIDAACETNPQYDNIKKSVAMLITQDGTRFCTGTLINNTRQNNRQLFLTANHCIFMSVTNFVAVFNYQSKVCGGIQTIEPSTLQSVHGMDLIASYAASDFALLEIREKIPVVYDVYFAGWDISTSAPSNVTCIHHPSGDTKKISHYRGTCLATSWGEYPRRLHWQVPKWSEGTTEPGSSGSALFNSKGLIVGHLHGGQASCSNINGFDAFGGIAFDWNGGLLRSRRLREHLNPTGSMISALGGMPLKSAKPNVG